MTQEEAAAACDLAPRHLQRIEAGSINVTLLTLAQLCAGLRLEPEELVQDAPKARKRPKGRPRKTQAG